MWAMIAAELAATGSIADILVPGVVRGERAAGPAAWARRDLPIPPDPAGHAGASAAGWTATAFPRRGSATR